MTSYYQNGKENSRIAKNPALKRLNFLKTDQIAQKHAVGILLEIARRFRMDATVLRILLWKKIWRLKITTVFRDQTVNVHTRVYCILQGKKFILTAANVSAMRENGPANPKHVKLLVLLVSISLLRVPYYEEKYCRAVFFVSWTKFQSRGLMINKSCAFD